MLTRRPGEGHCVCHTMISGLMYLPWLARGGPAILHSWYAWLHTIGSDLRPRTEPPYSWETASQYCLHRATLCWYFWVFCSLKRTASKHVYYLGWNRSPAQVGCMRQVLRAGALGRPTGIGWRGWWEGGLGWGIHVYPWLIHVNVSQKPLQYCKVISLQLIKINEKKWCLMVFSVQIFHLLS